MLLSYCDASAPITVADQQEIADHANSAERASLTKFKARVETMSGRWTTKAPPSADGAPYRVLTNGSGLYRPMASAEATPDGWEETGQTGTEDECMAFIYDRIEEDTRRQRGY